MKFKVAFVGAAALAVLVVASALVAARPYFWGKGRGVEQAPAPPPAPPAAEEKAPADFSDLVVYYLKMTAQDAYLVREVHRIPKPEDPYRAAVQELITGTPSTPGAQRVLPSGARVLGVTVTGGTATVNFSREVLHANAGASGEALGIASIVNTLTELPGVERVSFMVEGKLDEETMDWWGHVGLYEQPFKRDLSKVYEPAIWVTRPLPGQKVGFPLEVRGSARVFEGTVNLRLVEEGGRVLAETFATATTGAPGRGDFSAVLSPPAPVAGRGRLEVFWISPEDGREMDKVTVPLVW